MNSSDFENYNKKFFEIVSTFQEFKNSSEFHALDGNDKNNSNMVLSSFASFMAGQLKNNLNEEELLKSIELLDKIYLACSMKDQINDKFFNLIMSENNSSYSKFQENLSPELKKDLEDWSNQHGGKIFGDD